MRAIPIGKASGEKVLLVYHPASWNRPHMTLYKDGRYYRRGNFRAVLMREREVEAAYAARRATCGQGLGNTTSDEIVLRDTQAGISPAARAK